MKELGSIFRVHGLKESMSFRDLIRILLKSWRQFALLSAVAIVGAALAYNFLKSYTASGTLIINDSNNSTLQAFSSGYFGQPKSLTDSSENDSALYKYIGYLNSYEFYLKLASGLGPDLSKTSAHLGEELTEEFDSLQRDGIVELLRAKIKISAEGNSAIRVKAVAGSSEVAVLLVNEALELAKAQLRDREMREIDQVKKFFTDQMKVADREYAKTLARLSRFEQQPDKAVSLSSRDKMDAYLAELLIRANEVELKINENRELVTDLRRQISSEQSSVTGTVYGPTKKIDELVAENRLLREKRAEIDKSIEKLTVASRDAPPSIHRVSELKKKAELEFANFKELKSALARLDIQKISIDNRFGILESAHLQTARPQYSLLSLVLIGLFLAQALVLFWIYIQILFYTPAEKTGSSPPQSLVLDPELAKDPRFVIEEGQIRFRTQTEIPPREKTGVAGANRESE